ncbi:MAG: hypothetical protein ABIR34_02130, partial [Marmoricola sp.]
MYFAVQTGDTLAPGGATPTTGRTSADSPLPADANTWVERATCVISPRSGASIRRPPRGKQFEHVPAVYEIEGEACSSELTSKQALR